MLLMIHSEQEKNTVLLEAEHKFSDIKKHYWFPLAVELRGEEEFKFIRAYTQGTYRNSAI